jgi:asparagine synthase (glutamine-hydrolysing)
MCGIAGAINFSGINDEAVRYVKVFNDSMPHRGPDADGLFFDNFVALGHRRLSIIDLSESSNQPMSDSDEKVIVVFNGEIYNYADLRIELAKEYTFRTDHSDTETIIYAFRKWGVDAVHRFTGMFAIAIYDVEERKCFLFRDRFGKKPLYYTTQNGTLYFASENHSFFNAGILSRDFNSEAIYHYLTFLTVDAPNTFFKNVYKLQAGHYMEISLTGVKTVKFWDIADYINREIDDSCEVAVEKSEALLERSMKHRNIADVPVSLALSGGLDSSLNLYYSKRYCEGEISAINISYVEKTEFDESIVAKRFSKEKGIRFISKQIDQHDYNAWIGEYLSIQKDTPIGDPNSPLLYGISKIAHENGCKVLLVGEGGDEIGGYPVYERLLKLNRYVGIIPDFLKPAVLKLPIPEFLKRELDISLNGSPILRRFVFGFSEEQKRVFWKKKKNCNSYDVLKSHFYEIRDDLPDSFLRKVLNLEYKVRLAELILPRVDYPSMATSVEARSPFMDHHLIEYSASLPYSIKMKNGAKTIFKKIAHDKLPSYILNHPKVGFDMLLVPFLHYTLPVWFKTSIVEADSPVKDFILDDFLEAIYRQHIKTKRQGVRLWILYSLHRWMKMNET